MNNNPSFAILSNPGVLIQEVPYILAWGKDWSSEITKRIFGGKFELFSHLQKRVNEKKIKIILKGLELFLMTRVFFKIKILNLKLLNKTL